MTLLEGMLRSLVIAAGLLLPGAGWALGGRWPWPGLAAGILSVLAIFAGVIGLAMLGLPVTFGTLAAWLAVVTVSGGIFWRRRGAAPATPGPPLRGWWFLAGLAPMLFVAGWRALVQPLPGADADFRWDHVARLLVQTGGLDYYPPATPEAFAHYFWADGIAPLVSGLYAWTYLAAGSTVKTWTAIPVLLQVAGLLGLLHGLARWWQPEARAGWLACVLAGATMLLQFSFSLGQETGFTALGAGGMLLYLLHWQRRGELALLVPAALGAGLAACAREYGALFAGLGLAWVAVQGRSWRGAGLFAAVAGVWPLLWHLRVWHVTGNPLYAHDVAGLFPVNPVFNAWMQGYVETYGRVLTEPAGWREILRLWMLSAVPATAGLVAGAVVWRGQPGHVGWCLLAALAAAAWLASVPLTAGGLFYSMRVLSPLLVLGCAWGGAVLARWVPGRRHLAGLLLGLGLFGADAALRALTIPLNPYATPPREWLGAGYRLQDDFARLDEPFIRAVAQRVSGRVLSESAGVQHVFLRQGKTLSPLWSPEVGFLFSPDFTGDAVTRLRELGYSHLLLTRVQSSVDFLARTGALRRLEGRLEPVMANDTFVLFAFKAAGPPAAAAP